MYIGGKSGMRAWIGSTLICQTCWVVFGLYSKLESIVNKMGQNQDRLITLEEFTNDICTIEKEETTDKKRPDITFPKFPSCLVSFDIDPPNIIPTKSYKRRK